MAVERERCMVAQICLCLWSLWFVLSVKFPALLGNAEAFFFRAASVGHGSRAAIC